MTLPNKPTIQRTNENQRQVGAFILVLAVVAIVIGGLYLAQTTTSLTTARDIRQLNEGRSQLERENEMLRAEIARLQNLEYLSDRAGTLGFRPAGPDDIIYLYVDGYVYNRPTPEITLIVPTATPETYDESFAGWLKRQFDALREDFREWAN